MCFFTSNEVFDINNWNATYQSCYGYDIDDYISTFKGKELATFNFEGTSSVLYGGLTGPLLNLMTYLYRPSGNSLSNANVIFKIGSEVSSTVGNDYFRCSDGDYFGSSYTSMTKDMDVSGYDDGTCSVVQSSTSTRVYY